MEGGDGGVEMRWDVHCQSRQQFLSVIQCDGETKVVLTFIQTADRISSRGWSREIAFDPIPDDYSRPPPVYYSPGLNSQSHTVVLMSTEVMYSSKFPPGNPSAVNSLDDLSRKRYLEVPIPILVDGEPPGNLLVRLVSALVGTSNGEGNGSPP